MNVKEVEVQAESMDSTVVVKWGEQNHLPPPTGTVLLQCEAGSKVQSVPLDCPVMFSPATWCVFFNSIWGLRKNDKDCV